MFRARKPVGLIGLPSRFTECDESVDAKDSEEESIRHHFSSQQSQKKKAPINDQKTDTGSHQFRVRVTSDSKLKVDPPIYDRNKENEYVYNRTKDSPYKTPTNTSTNYTTNTNPNYTTNTNPNYTSPPNNTTSCTFPGVHDNRVTSSIILAPHQNGYLKMTPSSTFPSSNPQSVERVQIRHATHQSFNPSRVTPVLSKQLQTTEPHNQEPQPSSQQLHGVGSAVPLHRNTSVPKKLDSNSKSHDQIGKQVIPNKKPPLNTAAVRQQQVSQNDSKVRKRSVDHTHELDSEIVVIKSQGSDRKYKKLKLLGTGGSSKVFKVIGENYQAYALKEVYMKHVDPAIKEAYVNEIRLLKRLSGKDEIITLYDYTWDRQEGVLYLLLEYAEMDLNAIIKSENSTNHMATVLYFWNQMLQIVKVIHEEGVIHNDLKPENFVCIGAKLRLIDFGISKRIEEEKTSFERDVRCGTINYMAPETIETHNEKDFYKVGRPSDVWSLGCILYQLIYGRTPFEHIKNKLKKWQAIIDSSVAIPFPELQNKAAIDIMQKCLCRNPKKRHTIDQLISHPFSQCLNQ